MSNFILEIYISSVELHPQTYHHAEKRVQKNKFQHNWEKAVIFMADGSHQNNIDKKVKGKKEHF